MRQSVSGFTVIRALLLVVGVAVLIVLAFWLAMVVVAVAAVYFLARFVVRAVTGRGRNAAPSDDTIIIQPGHRPNYNQGTVIVLPIDGPR